MMTRLLTSPMGSRTGFASNVLRTHESTPS
jgi:S-ribosylhomocysteine lyase LuxS involved in autoinducer biosynthesis